MSENGFSPGRGKTVTPSMNATWCDEFNAILLNEGKTINRLAQELIQDGIKYRKLHHGRNGSVGLPTEKLTQEEVAFLQTEIGQTLLENIVKTVLSINQTDINLYATNKSEVKSGLSEESPREVTSPKVNDLIENKNPIKEERSQQGGVEANLSTKGSDEEEEKKQGANAAMPDMLAQLNSLTNSIKFKKD